MGRLGGGVWGLRKLLNITELICIANYRASRGVTTRNSSSKSSGLEKLLANITTPEGLPFYHGRVLTERSIPYK